MSRKHFSWLAVLAVIATGVALFMPRQTSHVDTPTQGPLLPGFAAQANTIDWLRVTGAGDEVLATLERGPEQWTVLEAARYPADWDRLRTLLAGLAQARVIEAMTANPDYYDRLGVSDVSSPDAQGVKLEFAAATGLPAVILGNPAKARDGQYARLDGETQSVLIDRALDVPASREDWIDRTIVDIADDAVVQVDIEHADGETLRARKTSADDENFTLEGLAEGVEPKSAWTVNSLAGALAALRLDDVLQEDEIDWTGATVYRVVTADGLEVRAETVVAPPVEEAEQTATEHWLRLAAGVYTTGLDTGVSAEADDAAARERAQAINARVQGWAYRIPEYKAATMSKRLSDLVQPADDGS